MPVEQHKIIYRCSRYGGILTDDYATIEAACSRASSDLNSGEAWPIDISVDGQVVVQTRHPLDPEGLWEEVIPGYAPAKGWPQGHDEDCEVE